MYCKRKKRKKKKKDTQTPPKNQSWRNLCIADALIPYNNHSGACWVGIPPALRNTNFVWIRMKSNGYLSMKIGQWKSSCWESWRVCVCRRLRPKPVITSSREANASGNDDRNQESSALNLIALCVRGILSSSLHTGDVIPRSLLLCCAFAKCFPDDSTTFREPSLPPLQEMALRESSTE